MRAQPDTGDRNANGPAAVVAFCDRVHARNFLEINQVIGLNHSGAHLNKHVRATGQKPGDARRGGSQPCGVLETRGCVVLHLISPVSDLRDALRPRERFHPLVGFLGSSRSGVNQTSGRHLLAKSGLSGFRGDYLRLFLTAKQYCNLISIVENRPVQRFVFLLRDRIFDLFWTHFCHS